MKKEVEQLLAIKTGSSEDVNFFQNSETRMQTERLKINFLSRFEWMESLIPANNNLSGFS